MSEGRTHFEKTQQTQHKDNIEYKGLEHRIQSPTSCKQDKTHLFLESSLEFMQF